MTDDVNALTPTSEPPVIVDEYNHNPDFKPEIDIGDRHTEPKVEPATEDDKPADKEPDENETEKRLKKLQGAERLARREAKRLQAENDILKGQRTEAPDAEFERKVTERATQVAAQNAYTEHCNKIYNAGVVEYGKEGFDAAVAAINETFGGLPPTFVEAVTDATDSPHKMLAYLGENSDLLEEIAQMPPHRQGAALAKLDVKLNTPQPPKPVSKAPPPIRPVSGSAKAEFDFDKASTAEQVRYFDEQDRRRRYG